ncbi:MAG: NADP-dependent oxidoreductase [Mycobacterium sp.]|uniref:NADP-dependent oxidoreductase n=1 Tax=Mycobacterium sp. TaxID=1785 RepID=UPI003BB4B6C6
MKAIRFHEYGDIDVLRYEETPTPRPRSGEALVAVAATAFNPVDTWFRAGIIDQIFPVPFPHTLGLDLAGTVVAHGPGTEDPAIGTEVIGFLPMTGPGAAAEYVTAPAEVLVRAPANIPLIDAAAIPVPALTAWQALFEHGNLVAGQSVLVNGAGGGVGGFVVQLAKQAGATVIATASPRSADPTRAAGADHIIDYTAATITDTLDAPVDLAINLVAGTGTDTANLLNVIKPGGTLVTATPPGAEFPDHTQRVVFFSVRSDTTQLTHIVELIDSGQLHLDISARRPLSDTAQLHQQSEDGALRGRTLLIP